MNDEDTYNIPTSIIVLSIITFFMIIITSTLYVVLDPINSSSDEEKEIGTATEPFLQNMEMTTRENEIFNAVGTNNTLAYDVFLPNVDDFEFHYWIELHRRGMFQENVVESSFHSIPSNDTHSFILVETPVYENSEIVSNAYSASMIGNDTGHQYSATYESVPSYPKNLSNFEDLSDRIPLTFNEEIILAVKIENKLGEIEHTGILDHSDPNFQTMLDDADHAYIYKAQIIKK